MSTSNYQEKREMLLEIMRDRKFPGNKLPKEETLTEMLSCSKGTLREILKELEFKGYITKKQSIGNFIHPSAFQAKMRIELCTGFRDLIRSGGFEPSVKIIKHMGDTTDIPPAVQERMGIQSGEGAKETERLYFADGQPAILSKWYIPKGIVLRDGSEEGATLFDLLKRFCDQEVEQIQLHFFIEQAEGEVAGFLSIEPGKPLLLWEETAYNYCDEIIAVSHNYFNQDIMQLSMFKRYQKNRN